MHIRSTVAALLPFVCSVPQLAAQTLVPATATTQSGDYRNLSLFYGPGRAHTQALYATSEVGLGTGTIHGLRYRRSTFQSGPAQAGTIFATITLSVSPTSPLAPSTDFAANQGPNPTVVFSGPINLTATPASTPWPAAWEAPIVFQTPYAYDGSAGQSLVVDISVAGSSIRSSWHASCFTIGYGTGEPELIQTACTTAFEGRISGSYGFGQFQPYLGGQFSLSHLGYAARPSFAFSWMLIGFGATGTPFAGQTLPVTLNSLGLAADPDCMLAVTPDLVEPMQYFPGSNGGIGAIGFGPVPVPSDPSWLGQRFFTQSISIDYDNTGFVQPLFFPSLALRWTIGSGAMPTASQVVRYNDTIVPAPTGGITIGEAPVFLLDLR